MQIKKTEDFVFVSKFINFKEAFKNTVTGRMLTANGVNLNEVPVIARANIENISGKIVIGCLPLYLAAFATCVIGTYISTSKPLDSKVSAERLQKAIHAEFYYMTATMTFNEMLDD